MAVLQDVARLRAVESRCLQSSGHSLGAVYLQGYNVECLLKHYYLLRRKRYPDRGREGHDLRSLWEGSGIPGPPGGHAREFLEVWSTALRYESALPAGADAECLLKGARDLATRVTYRIRSEGSNRARRRRRADRNGRI